MSSDSGIIQTNATFFVRKQNSPSTNDAMQVTKTQIELSIIKPSPISPSGGFVCPLVTIQSPIISGAGKNSAHDVQNWKVVREASRFRDQKMTQPTKIIGPMTNDQSSDRKSASGISVACISSKRIAKDGAKPLSTSRVLLKSS
jgi:hypothetical protein